MTPSPRHEHAAAEMIGALVLIAIFAVGIAVVAVNLFSSSQQPQTIPAVRAVITNSSTTITLSHIGGDPIPLNLLSILVDGVPTAFSCNGCYDNWTIGESIELHPVSPQMPNKVDIIYKGPRNQQLLETQYLGLQTPPFIPGPPPVTTPTPVPAIFHTITANPGSNGFIIPGSSQVADGSSITFTILPDNSFINYHIADVTVDGVSQGSISSYTFTDIRNDHTISATFAINLFTISTSTSSGGHILEDPSGTIAPSTISVTSGENRAFTIQYDPGYFLVDTLIDGVSIGANTSYTFFDIQADHTIAALFNAFSFKITPFAGPGGSITPSSVQTVFYTGSQVFNIIPDTGYHILDVTVDGISQGPLSNYTFLNVVANHAINATFEINRYTITPTAGPGGSITPFTVQTVNYGDNLSFTITPDTGYHIADVLVNGVSVGPVTSYTFTNVTTNQTIAATFGINTYTITATAGSNGAIAPAGVMTVNYGGSQAYTITPNTGYHVADVLVNGVSVGPVTSYTFTNVTTNQTIAATFGINTYTITATVGSNGVIAPAGVTTVNYGGSQAYTITPDTGYHVADVHVSGTSVGPVTNYTFTNVTANQTIAAIFAINTYTITASSGANGAVTPAGVTTVNYGDSQAYTIAATTAGYHIANVLVDGVSNGTISSYTFTNVQTNHTISATFAINTYTITPSISGGNGTVSPATVQTVNYGDTPTFTFTPATGYHLNTVTVDGIPVTPSGNSYTFPAVTASHAIMGTFTPDPPTFISITPSSGPTAGGTAVTIVGTNFVSGGSFGVTIGGAAATSVVRVDSAHITAVTPAGIAGARNVVITNNDGQTATGTGAYTYVAPAPTFVSITPNSGTTLGGTAVTIVGTNFVSGGSFGVTIGGAAATSVVRVDSAHITAVTPAGTAGARNVVITNNDGQTATGTGAYTYVAPAPTVTAITPNSGSRNSIVTITNLAGTNFVVGTTPTVRLTQSGGNTYTATNVVVSSSIKITCTIIIPNGGTWGLYNVVVTNTDGQSGTLTNGFTVIK